MYIDCYILVMGGIGNTSRRYVVQKILRYHGIYSIWDMVMYTQ